MARPTTKSDLITTANERFEKLWALIDGMSEEKQNAAFSGKIAEAGKEAHWKRDKNLRDVLVHLFEWHQLLLNWVISNRKGESRPFLPDPYNWKTYPAMNMIFWEKHQGTPLPEAMDKLKDSHQKVMTLINAFSNEELFSKGAFAWTGNSALGAYCVSVTSSHYDWAIKKIKLHSKSAVLP